MTGTTPPVITVDELIEKIKVGPGGPKVAAFFDFDGTLIEGYSAGALYAHRARNFELGPDEFVRTLRAAIGGPLAEEAFKDLLLQGIRGWVGRTEDDLMELGEQLFAQEIAGALFHDAWRLVRAHQNQGHTVVIATSATRMQAQPMARELGVDHVVCTELEIDNGVLTGGITGRPPWGEGKLAAVKEFARRKRIPLKNSHAYANGDEDVPFLGSVGFPHPVNPGSVLARHASESGWQVLRFRTRRSQFHPMALARTSALFGGFAAAVGAGAVAGLLTLDRRGGDGPGHLSIRPVLWAIGQYPHRCPRRGAHHTPTSGVLHQPPEHADRRDDHLARGPTGLHRGGQGGGEEDTGARATSHAGRRRVSGPCQYGQSNFGDAAGGGQAACRGFDRNGPRRHAVADPARRGVQERRLSPGPRRRRADRSDRHPQRR